MLWEEWARLMIKKMKKNWKTNKLVEVCDVFGDGDWIEKKDQSSDGIRLIQTGNIGNGIYKDRDAKARYISGQTFKRLHCTEILPGDCLISRLPDPVGRSCIIPNNKERMITAVDCTILRFQKEVIIPQWFIYYSLSQEYQNQINKQVSGATRQRISRNNLGLIEIPIPPLSIQRHIIKKLDKIFAGIEKARQNTEKNLQNARELFEAYLQSIFANPGKGWEEKALGEIGEITSSKRVYKREYVKEGVPFYRIKEIKELANKKSITVELFISKNRYAEIKNIFGVPSAGDILMTAVGTIGETYVVEKEDEFYFKDGNVLWFKKYHSVDPYYLKYVLMAFVEKIKKLSAGAAYKALTIEKLNKHKIFIPPLPEQRAIVKKLDALVGETKKLEAIYQKKLTDLDELKKTVLKKAFAGEL